MAHAAKNLGDPSNVTRTILYKGRVAGNVASFLRGGKREVCYWLGSEFWGLGVGTEALAQFLAVDRTRPLLARVAKSNVPSLRVVQKNGFKLIAEDRWVSGGVEILEFVLQLT